VRGGIYPPAGTLIIDVTQATSRRAADEPTKLPVIDLSAADDPARADAFHHDLHAAAHEVGFFQLVGHGIGPEQADELLDLVRRFFALPEADRLAVGNLDSPHFRGYTRIGHELTGGRSDWRDQLDVGPELPALVLGPHDPAYLWLQGPNRWPDDSLPALREGILAWQDRLAAIAHRLLRELLVSLQAPRGFFDAAFADKPHLHTKLVRYPGRAPDGSEQGVGWHKDYGFLTLLLQDEHGGLEVQGPSGGVIHVDPLRGAFVVNLGELLEIATDGYLVATNHRVVSPASGAERYSVPFFYGPRLDARVEPVPGDYLADAPGVVREPENALYEVFGWNELKGYVRSHPEVARKHHPDAAERFPAR
jgi:isopenicillin N synthase-like dioxygenase